MANIESSHKSITQQLLYIPKSGVEVPFLDALEKRHSALRRTHPIRAELAIAGEFTSAIFNLFAHLAIFHIMDRVSQRIEANSLVAEDAGIPIYGKHTHGSRFASKSQEDYSGALHTFMQNGADIVIPAATAVTYDVAQGSAQVYQPLWQVLEDACGAKTLIEKDFQRTDKKARIQLPFDLSQKSSDEKLEEILERSLVQNIESAMGIAISHAVAKVLTEGRLPEAAELANSLHAMENEYDAIASTNRQLFAELFLGRPLLNQINQARLKGEIPPVSKRVSSILSKYIANSKDPDVFTNFATDGNILHVANGPLHPSLEEGSWENHANCGGQIPLFPRRQDIPRVVRFSQATGAPLPEAFSAARVILRMSKELARRTIYADPVARDGIVAIAQYIRDQ
jgi:hypothetical protein